MLLVGDVKPAYRKALPADFFARHLMDRLYVERSALPAITHLDFSARVQTVHEETNPRFSALLDAFAARTGVGMLINTSFNVRGEPIVCTPEDAYRCFMATEMDVLVIDDWLFLKTEQPGAEDRSAWQQAFAAD
jgi:carbamoyltransferase